ncbi:MAG: 2-aminoethylphosphonate--pyruvate transaminase [Vicinamibacteria bacterium]|nr:2-aminoethylphosphonate--pyruvate transaminase [Vicinamibacteria bacterium]
MERRILLNPGPATTTDSVKQALVIPDVCPREPEFTSLMREMRTRLVRIVGDPSEASAIPVAGSGTAALEAAFASFIGDGLVLIIDNGDYGRRLADIAARLGLRHRVISFGWGVPLDLARFDTAVGEGTDRATHAALVHHETSTGMLNPLEEFVARCRHLGLVPIVDAMSSFGVLETPVGRNGIGVVISSANKCLQGMAGVAFAVVSKEVIEAARKSRPRSLYFDLIAEHDHLEKTGQSRFTMPPQVVSALVQALREHEQEGMSGRRGRYHESMETLVRGLRELGFEMLLDDRHQSRILVAVKDPGASWFDFNEVHDALYAQGFTIYPGKPQGAPTFRLSVLGAIDRLDIERFLAALNTHLARHPDWPGLRAARPQAPDS